MANAIEFDIKDRMRSEVLALFFWRELGVSGFYDHDGALVPKLAKKSLMPQVHPVKTAYGYGRNIVFQSVSSFSNNVII